MESDNVKHAAAYCRGGIDAHDARAQRTATAVLSDGTPRTARVDGTRESAAAGAATPIEGILPVQAASFRGAGGGGRTDAPECPTGAALEPLRTVTTLPAAASHCKTPFLHA